MKWIKKPTEDQVEGYCFFIFGCHSVCEHNCGQVCISDCVSKSPEVKEPVADED